MPTTCCPQSLNFLLCYCCGPHIWHSLIISREVLFLTLLILTFLQGCISWYIPRYGLMMREWTYTASSRDVLGCTSPPTSRFPWALEMYNPIHPSSRQCTYTIHPSSRQCTYTFFHHWQGSIDFNTVNIQRTRCVYFLIFTVHQWAYREILP